MTEQEAILVADKYLNHPSPYHRYLSAKIREFKGKSVWVVSYQVVADEDKDITPDSVAVIIDSESGEIIKKRA